MFFWKKLAKKNFVKTRPNFVKSCQLRFSDFLDFNDQFYMDGGINDGVWNTRASFFEQKIPQNGPKLTRRWLESDQLMILPYLGAAISSHF